jgi:hypothetical protein
MTPNLQTLKVKILCPTKDWILYQLSHSKIPIRYIVLYTIISAFQVLFLLHKSLIKINLLWLNPNSFFWGGQVWFLCVDCRQRTMLSFKQLLSGVNGSSSLPHQRRGIFIILVECPAFPLLIKALWHPPAIWIPSWVCTELSKTLLSWTILWQKVTLLILRSGSISDLQ